MKKTSPVSLNIAYGSSSDLSVEISHFKKVWKMRAWGKSIKSICRRAIHEMAATVPVLRDQIEAVARLHARTRWLIDSPRYI